MRMSGGSSQSKRQQHQHDSPGGGQDHFCGSTRGGSSGRPMQEAQQQRQQHQHHDQDQQSQEGSGGVTAAVLVPPRPADGTSTAACVTDGTHAPSPHLLSCGEGAAAGPVGGAMPTAPALLTKSFHVQGACLEASLERSPERCAAVGGKVSTFGGAVPVPGEEDSRPGGARGRVVGAHETPDGKQRQREQQQCRQRQQKQSRTAAQGTGLATAGSTTARQPCGGDGGLPADVDTGQRGDRCGGGSALVDAPFAPAASLETHCATPFDREDAVVSAAAAAAAAAVVAAAAPLRTARAGGAIPSAAQVAMTAALSVGAAEAEAPSVWELDSLDFQDDDDDEEEQQTRKQCTEVGDAEGVCKNSSQHQARMIMLSRPREDGHAQESSQGGEMVTQQAEEQEKQKDTGSSLGGGRKRADRRDAGQAPPTPPQPHAGMPASTTAGATAERRTYQADLGSVSSCEGPSSATAAATSEAEVTAVPCDRARELMPPPPPNLTRAKMRRRRSRVSLMHSPRYQRLCGLLERHGRRDDLLYALLGACGLPERLSIIAPARATDVHLRAYHDRDYIEALRHPPSDVKSLDEYGLLEDCEVFEELYDYCCAVAGASLHAADRLCRGEADVAINWGGGRHHAKKGQASGFCYVNDGVLAVLHLAKAFGTVLTIDIDVHHGDGLQEAFYFSNKVMTMSFHHLAEGFFPGAGQCSERGAGNGTDFNLNIPLREGCGDAAFLRVFTSALEAVTSEGFQPEAVVLLCGADTLSADPLGPFNLTTAGIRSCVELVVGLELPLLLLGGGGYCPTDTARLWTSLTAAAVGADALASLPATVPDHAYFPLYGPDFRMATREKTLPDKNDEVFLGRLCDFAAQAGRGRRVGAARRKRERSCSASASAEFRDDFGYTEASTSW
ncbi:unnamed protein product [Scytosiphon promiscuus]